MMHKYIQIFLYLMCYFGYERLISILSPLGAWILTNGLRFGITKHLGQAVRDHSLASTSSKVRVVAIGIAPWNMIHNREALLSAKVSPRTASSEFSKDISFFLQCLSAY